jgi:hypothetical protein
MNSQDLTELKKLQSELEKARDNYLRFLISKNYKIRIYESYENSLVTAIHRDYLDEEESQYYRDYVKEDSPDWAEIILFDLETARNNFKPYESK